MWEPKHAIRMFQLMDRMRRAWLEFTPRSELNKSQLVTLLTLRHGTSDPSKPACKKPSDPMTLSTLATCMGQSMPAISQRINKLEAMGYVQREPDQKDRRTTWIHLTPSGEEVLVQAFSELMGRIEWILERMGESDTEQVFRLLEKLSDVMESAKSQDCTKKQMEEV